MFGNNCFNQLLNLVGICHIAPMRCCACGAGLRHGRHSICLAIVNQRQITAIRGQDLSNLAAYAARPGIAAIFTAADIPGRNAFGVIPPFADQPALAPSPARFRARRWP